MYPILWHWGKLTIYSHGLLSVIGFLVAAFLIWFLASKEKLLSEKRIDLFDFLIWLIIFGILGARLLYVILYYKQFSSFWEVFTLWNGGLVSFGGILAALAFGIWYLARKKQNVWVWLDVGILGFLAGWFFGRIGCFLAGDIPGKEIMTHFASKLSFLGQPPTHPVPLYEALLVLVLFIVIWLIYRKKILGDGWIFLIGFLGYFLGRFIIDFWRMENVVVLGLTWGQIGSLIFLVAIFIFGILKMKYFNKVKSKERM